MATKKAATKQNKYGYVSNLKPYPQHQAYRSGCKVSWYTYATEADARAAQIVAQHNGRILEGQGYDFGYQSPGSITDLGPGKGYEVTIP